MFHLVYNDLVAKSPSLMQLLSLKDSSSTCLNFLKEPKNKQKHQWQKTDVVLLCHFLLMCTHPHRTAPSTSAEGKLSQTP